MKPYYETKLGKLYHGDCLEILPYILETKVDLVLTDPVWPNNKLTEFKDIDPYKLFKDMISVLPGIKRICIHLGCDSDPRILKYIKQPYIRTFWLKYVLPGFKGRVLYSGDVGYLFGEPPAPIKNKQLISGEKLSTSNFGKEANHPCPRKMEHVKFLVNECSRLNELILDPFLGSGTTAVAAESLNRRWIGIEKEQKYCDIAIQRLENEVQYELF